jgi:hypothetical protein
MAIIWMVRLSKPFGVMISATVTIKLDKKMYPIMLKLKAWCVRIE